MANDRQRALADWGVGANGYSWLDDMANDGCSCGDDGATCGACRLYHAAKELGVERDAARCYAAAWRSLAKRQRAELRALRAKAQMVADHALLVEASKPQVCCYVDCPNHGNTGDCCEHSKHPSGWLGMGSHLWEEIDAMREALDDA